MVAIGTAVLIVMLGLVLDLGHLYIVKTELQNAADACALAAVWEMAPYNDTARDRTIAAGKAVGRLNLVNFQSTEIPEDDWEITFSEHPDSGFGSDLTPASWYVRCRPHGEAGKSIAMWFIGVWGLLSSGQATYSSAVSASAVAGVRPCVFPLSFTSPLANPKDDATGQYGFKLGHWYSGKLDVTDAERGQFGWIELAGCHSASCLADQIAGNGVCDVEKEGAPLKTGDIAKMVQAWNTRFGLYRGSFKDRETYRPDTTGFGYSWETPPPGVTCDQASRTCDAYENYTSQQGANEPFQLTTFLPTVTGYKDSDVAQKDELIANGVAGRRLVVMPVVSSFDYDNKSEATIYGWACGLMLSPVSGNEAAGNVEVSLQFLGSLKDSPCVGVVPTGRTIIPQLVR